MPVLAKKNGKWVTIANYTPNATSSSKFKIFTYIPTVDDLEEGEVGFYIYIPDSEDDELKLLVERAIIEAHIPDAVTSIGNYAFRNCTSLETVIFKGTPTSINSTAFSNCTQDTLNIYVPWSEGEVANAPWGATNATIHYNTDTSTMGSTTLNTKYPKTYASIIDRSITEINENNFPQNVASIGDYTFNSCISLTSVMIPDGVTSIGNFAFAYCMSLTNVIIPDSVTSIGEHVFSGCISLVSINIPDSVTSIGYYAFFLCQSLETVIFKGTPSSIASNAFIYCYQSTLNIYVPWSEGEVANAPWGATNATIHYNTDTSNM